MNCDVVKDLLPLYHDGVCSEESMIEIEKHLKECEDCQKYLEEISKKIIHYSNRLKEEEKLNLLKAFRKKFFKKRTVVILIVIFSVFIVLYLSTVAYYYVTDHEFPIAYEDTIDTLSVIQLSFNRKTSMTIPFTTNNLNHIHRVYILVNQVGDENIAYAYFTKTLINSKVFSSMLAYRPARHYNRGGIIYTTGASEFFWEDISAVYYVVKDIVELAKMSDEAFAEATKDAVLLWEK